MERMIELTLGPAHLIFEELSESERLLCDLTPVSPIAGLRPMNVYKLPPQKMSETVLMDVIFIIQAILHAVSPADLPLAFVILKPETCILSSFERNLVSMRDFVVTFTGSLEEFFTDMISLKKMYAFDEFFNGKRLSSSEIRSLLEELEDPKLFNYLDALSILTGHDQYPLRSKHDLLARIKNGNDGYSYDIVD